MRTATVNMHQLIIAWSALLLFVFAPVVHAGPLESSMEIQSEIHEAAAASQQEVNRLSDDTLRLLQGYQDILGREEPLRLYNDQIEKMIASQREEMASFEQQLAEIEVTHREIVPLTIRMVDRLAQFVSLDRPFLMAERAARVEALRKLIAQADVPLSEKYRRVMEAYQGEMTYGRTIEASTGRLDQEGKNRTVQFLRIGRVALLYLSLDGKEAGYWEAREKAWKKLPDDYLRSIEQGLRIARKEAPPDLLKLPIAAPEASR